MYSIGNLTVNTTASSHSNLLFSTFFPVVVIVPILGFPTNVYVLWILLRKPGLCSTTDIFIVNLTLLDALCCLVQPAEVTSAIFSPEGMELRSVFLNQFAGPLFQMLVCVDCYIGVVHPVVFLRFKMPKFRLALCAIVWATTIFMSVISLAGSYYKVLEGVTGFLITDLCIMLFCNVQVLQALKQRGPGCQQVHPARLKAHRTILALLIMVIVHYIPPVVCLLVIVFSELHTSLFSIIAVMTACISSCDHPFFYLFKASKTSCLSCQKSQAKVKKLKADRTLAKGQP